MYKYAEYIRKTLGNRELLEQLAEEDAEQAKAALKLIRASGESKNTTPKSYEDALAEYTEESMDVLVVMYLLGFNSLWCVVKDNWKWERWAKRLGYKEA